MSSIRDWKNIRFLYKMRLQCKAVNFPLTEMQSIVSVSGKRVVVVANVNIALIGHSHSTPIFFHHSFAFLNHTPGTSPHVTPVITYLVIPILLFSTQSPPHDSIQQTTINHLALPLRNSCLFWVVQCFCIYECNLCCKVSQSRL